MMYHFLQKSIFWEGGTASQLKCSILILFPQTFSQTISTTIMHCLLSEIPSFFLHMNSREVAITTPVP